MRALNLPVSQSLFGSWHPDDHRCTTLGRGPYWVPEGSLAGIFGVRSGPPGPARPPKSGQTAFRYPARALAWTCSGPRASILSTRSPRGRGKGLVLVLYVTQYRCLRNKRPSEPYEFIGFGAMDVTKPDTFVWFGDIHGLKPYKSIRFRWAFISQTPVVPLRIFGFWMSVEVDPPLADSRESV